MGDRELAARCPLCRGRVTVEERDSDGDQIHCDNCGGALKVRRREAAVRLVVADVAPFRDELRATQQRVRKLEHDLLRARHSFGIGANGLGLGLIFIVYQIGLNKAMLDAVLLRNAVLIAVISGVLLELANHLFLAKRQAITRLGAEIAELRSQAKQIQRTIREATRG
jgi:hypothetical protein